MPEATAAPLLSVRELWKKSGRIPIMFREDARLMVCPQCTKRTDTKHVFAYCKKCALCNKCGLLPWISEDQHRCEDCVCNECWESDVELVLEETVGTLRCRICRTAKKCDICNRVKPRFKARDTNTKKIISWCGNCKSYENFNCFFCNSQAQTVIQTRPGQVTCCSECRKMICCYKNKCSPTHQCNSCLVQQEAQENSHAEQPTGAPYVKNPIKFFGPVGIKDRRLNRSTRFAGIEIEIANFDHSDSAMQALKRVADKWSANIVRDGSIPASGIEICTSPAAGDLLMKQIDDWTEVLREVQATTTNACGLHVHADARDHNIPDLAKLIRYYAFLEPALIRTQPFARVMLPSPINNRYYCKPCGPKYIKELDKMSPASSNRIYNQAMKNKLIENIYGRNTRPLKNEHYAQAKYHAANFHSYFYKERKTVENRLHTGTVLPRKIKDWTLLWIAIVDYAYNNTEKALPLTGSVDDSIKELLRVAPTERCRSYIQNRITDFRKPYDIEDAKKIKQPKQVTELTDIFNGNIFNNPWAAEPALDTTDMPETQLIYLHAPITNIQAGTTYSFTTTAHSHPTTNLSTPLPSIVLDDLVTDTDVFFEDDDDDPLN